jgi:uncharacterized protein Usg
LRRIHAILSKETWAKKRMEEAEEIGEDPSLLLSEEYKKYAGVDFWNYKTFKDYNIEQDFPNFYKWLEIIQEDLNSNLDEEQEPYDIETSLDLVLDENFESFSKNLERYNKNLHYRVMLDFYKVVFDVWFSHWRGESIEATRKIIENIYDDLNTIKSKPINKIFQTINEAIQASHQTGPMMDYISQKYDVGVKFLDHLSNMDTKPWDKDLKGLI